MALEGRVRLTARLQKGAVGGLDIAVERPYPVRQLLQGCGPLQAVSRIEQLYVICRQSQKTAAQLALDCPLDLQLAQQRILLESIEQLFWRLAIDLPHQLALGSGAEPFAAMRRFISQQLAAEVLDRENSVLLLESLSRFFQSLTGSSVDGFRQLDRQSFLRWLKQENALVPNCLRRLQSVPIQATIDSDQLLPLGVIEQQGQKLLQSMTATDESERQSFCRCPSLNDIPYETGPLAYTRDLPLIAELRDRRENPLLIRYAARLMYLAELLGSERLLTPFGVAGVLTSNGWRMSWVNSVRGLLLHSTRVSEGVVDDYQICAPTEWNFHPQGAMLALAAGVRAGEPETLKKYLELAALSLDPCVGFEVQLAQEASSETLVSC